MEVAYKHQETKFILCESRANGHLIIFGLPQNVHFVVSFSTCNLTLSMVRALITTCVNQRLLYNLETNQKIESSIPCLVQGLTTIYTIYIYIPHAQMCRKFNTNVPAFTILHPKLCVKFILRLSKVSN